MKSNINKLIMMVWCFCFASFVFAEEQKTQEQILMNKALKGEIITSVRDLPGGFENNNTEIRCNDYTVDFYLWDSWGDGWNGGELEFQGQIMTIDSGSSALFSFCLPAGTYNPTFTEGDYSSENSWDVVQDGTYILGEFDNTPGPQTITVGPFGCADPTACNFDNTAVNDDQSCTYPNQNENCDGSCIDGLSYDCDGVCGGSNLPGTNEDCQGNCVPGLQEDCSGLCGGLLETDYCGVCGGQNLSLDCFGECSGVFEDGTFALAADETGEFNLSASGANWTVNHCHDYAAGGDDGSNLSFADSGGSSDARMQFGASQDMQLYHDGSNSFIDNAVGALRIATSTSGIAVTIGHTTSETTIADNLTVTGTSNLVGTLSLNGTAITKTATQINTAASTGLAVAVAIAL